MKVILSIMIGILIAAANFFAIIYIARGLICREDGKLRFGLFAGLKFLLLIAIFFMLIKYAVVNVIGLLAGFTAALLILIIMLPRFYKRTNALTHQRTST